MVTGKIRDGIEGQSNCGNCKGLSLEMRHVIQMRHNGTGLYGIAIKEGRELLQEEVPRPPLCLCRSRSERRGQQGINHPISIFPRANQANPGVRASGDIGHSSGFSLVRASRFPPSPVALLAVLVWRLRDWPVLLATALPSTASRPCFRWGKESPSPNLRGTYPTPTPVPPRPPAVRLAVIFFPGSPLSLPLSLFSETDF
ncbi:hypothetical protein CDV31_015619 [Fusarium ambrosium]|uniref:Uncharacterized protein n=1 Tax=Fusarium ambrosium TaxID=131363 RepID=A0A428SLN0_9HYPO|nr:hypothetical protein CDV31_015619 [Fusarium ambrosium]